MDRSEAINIMTRRVNGEELRLDTVPVDLLEQHMKIWREILPNNDIWTTEFRK